MHPIPIITAQLLHHAGGIVVKGGVIHQPEHGSRHITKVAGAGFVPHRHLGWGKA